MGGVRRVLLGNGSTVLDTMIPKDVRALDGAFTSPHDVLLLELATELATLVNTDLAITAKKLMPGDVEGVSIQQRAKEAAMTTRFRLLPEVSKATALRRYVETT